VDPSSRRPNYPALLSHFNTYLRDNLNECPTAKASAAGQIFVSTAANQVAARLVNADYIATQETTTSTSYTDLATSGPSVTATTSASAIVAIYCNQFHSTGLAAWMSYAISGATTDPSNDNRSLQLQSTGGQHIGATFFHSAILTPGTNTFKAEYRVSTSGTGTFSVRRLMVIPM
jgi:hypothetical protein